MIYSLIRTKKAINVESLDDWRTIRYHSLKISIK
jgi:hypothetical protein